MVLYLDTRIQNPAFESLCGGMRAVDSIVNHCRKAIYKHIVTPEVYYYTASVSGKPPRPF